MEHGKKNRKFGRETKQRKALMRGLEVAIIKSGRITTTLAKAKSLSPKIEKLITKSKTKSLANERLLNSVLPRIAVSKLFKEIAPRYAERHGGYTRILKIAPRTSDGAKMAIIEFV